MVTNLNRIAIWILGVAFSIGTPAMLLAQVVPQPPVAPGIPNVNNPYGIGSNPYSSIGPGIGGVNPLNPYGNNSSSYGNGYLPSPIGYYLPNLYSGAADIINSQGQFMMSTEMSRILREKAVQEAQKSLKAAIELERWIKATTPTFTELQLKAAKETLKRIQQSATPTEIWSGRALNIMLKDLAKFQGRNVDIREHKINPETLKHLNVAVKNADSLGLLRDNGRVRWPLALLDLTDEKTRKSIEIHAQDLVNQARSNGTVNLNTLKDLDSQINTIETNLSDQAAKIPARHLLQAQRFVDDFQSAIRALESKDMAVHYFNFQQWVKGGKTVQEIVDYMNKEGLSFGPAVDGDEFAYEALYSALANYNIAFNAQVAGIGGGNGNENK